MALNKLNAVRALNGPGGSITVNNSGLKATYVISVAEDNGQIGINLDVPFGSILSGNAGKYRLRRLYVDTNITDDSRWDELTCSFAEESAPGLNTNEVKQIRLTIGGASVLMEKSPKAGPANMDSVLYAADYSNDIKNALVAANGGPLVAEVEFLNATENLPNDGVSVNTNKTATSKTTKSAGKTAKSTDKKDSK
jgi:hypothetical protein